MANSEAGLEHGRTAAARFDQRDWMQRLLDLNPWLGANGLSAPRRSDWHELRGHCTGETFLAARKAATEARARAGKNEWNRWANAMQTLADELRAAGRWGSERRQRLVGEKYVYLRRADNDELAAFFALAEADFTELLFEGEADFREWRFPGVAFFEGATFGGKAIFGGAHFLGGADFREATFRGETIFAGATFRGGARFSGATFRAIALFTSAQFRSAADFRGATLRDSAVFSGALFVSTAGFGKTTFRDQANFSEVTFRGRSIFGSAVFREKVDFRGAVFRQRAVFGAALFRGWAGFSGATFRDAADFDSARLQAEAMFERVVFRDTASFRSAHFEARAAFGEVEFRGWAGFTSAEFKQRAVFRGARFRGNAGFGEAMFFSRADFRDTVFELRAEFVQAQFFGVSSFGAACFHGYTSFEAAQGKEGSSFAMGRAEFYGVPNFIQAHFREAPRLDDVKVGLRPRVGLWRINRDKDVAARWRNLKRLAIQGHDHQRELDFFAGEIRARRYVEDFPLPGRWRRSWKKAWRPLWPNAAQYWLGILFQLFSNFGRSMMRPILWWSVFVALFAGVNLQAHLTEAATLRRAAPANVFEWVAEGAPALKCIAGRGEAGAEALYLSAARGLVFTGLVGGARTPQTYACLYGTTEAINGPTLPGQYTPVVPPTVTYVAMGHLLLSVGLITLFLLALRNHFRIR
ncbi:MAG: pentapeptide repeat-containing protein [Neomegalonema sp.]|nr:pentapeptide repeat-containing protein [Neomegalonema sp.]